MVPALCRPSFVYLGDFDFRGNLSPWLQHFADDSPVGERNEHHKRLTKQTSPGKMPFSWTRERSTLPRQLISAAQNSRDPSPHVTVWTSTSTWLPHHSELSPLIPDSDPTNYSLMYFSPVLNRVMLAFTLSPQQHKDSVYLSSCDN